MTDVIHYADQDEFLIPEEEVWVKPGGEQAVGVNTSIDLPFLKKQDRNPGWREAAACRDADPSLFFHKKGSELLKAKEICATCSVTEPCLQFAEDNLLDGTWGGLSDRERKLRRRGLL